MTSSLNSISGRVSQATGVISTLLGAYSYTIHQMMVHHSDGMWVLDVAEKHVALVIACKMDIRVFFGKQYR